MKTRTDQPRREGPIRVTSAIKRFAIDLRVRLGYGTAFFLLLLSYLLTLYANAQLIAQAKLVDHSRNVLIHLGGLLSSMKDAEGGLRGYLLVKDRDFLEDYPHSRGEADSFFHLILVETRDEPALQPLLNRLGLLMDKKFQSMQGVIDFVAAKHSTADDELATRTWIDKAITNRARTTVQNIETAERSILLLRSRELNTRYVTLNTIIITSLITAFLLAIYGFMTYARENRARRQADDKVSQYQQQLELRIRELAGANAELIQMRSMEKLAATGRIARTIAHEVRNPLTNINLSVDQLKSDSWRETAAVRPMLDLISRNSERINALITALLNSTKFTELVFQRVSVNWLLDETLKLAEDRISLKNIQVIKNYDDRLKEILVDAERIKIAFLNIIVNAMEAMEADKGVLRLQTGSEGGKCLVIISDNGTGMDKESLVRLFEPYFTNKSNGTGLGLTNTQNIIMNHQGYIRAESEPGKGSSFIITLNFAPGQAKG